MVIQYSHRGFLCDIMGLEGLDATITIIRFCVPALLHSLSQQHYLVSLSHPPPTPYNLSTCCESFCRRGLWRTVTGERMWRPCLGWREGRRCSMLLRVRPSEAMGWCHVSDITPPASELLDCMLCISV